MFLCVLGPDKFLSESLLLYCKLSRFTSYHRTKSAIFWIFLVLSSDVRTFSERDVSQLINMGRVSVDNFGENSLNADIV